MTVKSRTLSPELSGAIKEGLRVFLMAGIPLAIVELGNGGGFDFRAILLAGVIALLRFIDKWLHNTGIAKLGITRF